MKCFPGGQHWLLKQTVEAGDVCHDERFSVREMSDTQLCVSSKSGCFRTALYQVNATKAQISWLMQDDVDKFCPLSLNRKRDQEIT